VVVVLVAVGSPVRTQILLFRPGAVQFTRDIAADSLLPVETLVQANTLVGMATASSRSPAAPVGGDTIGGPMPASGTPR
jgi:hypothetical protein